ncbi:MAG TPA: hypothetical protein VLJ13_02035 [Brevundimonas sp.]|nr:hypothetical protein [Brevundimonas sp.]
MPTAQTTTVAPVQEPRDERNAPARAPAGPARRQMHLKAVITIELDAADYIEAAEHQRLIEAAFGHVRTAFQDAELDLRESRPRRQSDDQSPATSRKPSGVRPISGRYADA